MPTNNSDGTHDGSNRNGHNYGNGHNHDDDRKDDVDDGDDRKDDRKKSNDDEDDELAQDEPHHPSHHRCNHLQECSDCVKQFTRKCEQIKLQQLLLETLQQQAEYNTFCQNMFFKAIQRGSSKSKKKFKSKLFDPIAKNKTKHDLYPSYRVQKNIKLSHKMTQDIVPKTINASISDAYAFVEKSIGMQYNDGQIHEHAVDLNTEYQIVNMDWYDKSNEPLYCIMKRMHSDRNYKWRILNQLFTASEAMKLSDAPLPRSSRRHLQRMSAQFDLKQFTFDSQSIRRIIKQCKWNTIPVFKRKENKQRLTFSMAQEELNPIVQKSLASIENDTTRLIPILMFDNTSNTHWIEHILVVHIRSGIDIGISLRCGATHDGVQITGIHLDKEMILEQHEVLLSHSQHSDDVCHCLDGFTSTINDMRVGDCDDLMNQMKCYKQKYHGFKLLALKFINGKDTEKYEILQQHAEAMVKHDNGSLSYSDACPQYELKSQCDDSTAQHSIDPYSHIGPSISAYPSTLSYSSLSSISHQDELTRRLGFDGSITEHSAMSVSYSVDPSASTYSISALSSCPSYQDELKRECDDTMPQHITDPESTLNTFSLPAMETVVEKTNSHSKQGLSVSGLQKDVQCTKCNTAQTKTHVFSVSEPHHIHIAADDYHQHEPLSPIDMAMTEDELANVIDLLEFDMMQQLGCYSNIFDVDQTDGMIQCSGQTNADADFNAHFQCNRGNINSLRKKDNTNDDRKSEDNRENDDEDDECTQDDAHHHPSQHGCNHLRDCPSFQGRECTECVKLHTRRCEQIKLLISFVHNIRQKQDTLQEKHDYDTSFQNMINNAIASNKKSKKKLKSTARDLIAESKTQYDLFPSYRAKKHIKLSREMTETIIPSVLHQVISNGYAFMEKSIGMQHNCGQLSRNPRVEYQIINVDCYNEANEPLYCIMKRIPANRNANCKWQIQDKLFTASEAIQLSSSRGPLPRSSRVQLQQISARYNIKQFRFDSEFIARVIKQCKWNTIPVFKRKENKQRLTLCMTQEELNPIIKRSMANIKTACLIPILMFDNASNTHWIEYILRVQIRDNIDIGISLRYSVLYGVPSVQITGIHLDKVMILEQHEVLLSHSQSQHVRCNTKVECHCLDGFTSIINDMRVGNCDALMNELKNYKQRYHRFKLLARKFTNTQGKEKHEILQQLERHTEVAVMYDDAVLKYVLCPGSPPSTISASSRGSSSPSLQNDELKRECDDDDSVFTPNTPSFAYSHIQQGNCNAYWEECIDNTSKDVQYPKGNKKQSHSSSPPCVLQSPDASMSSSSDNQFNHQSS